MAIFECNAGFIAGRIGVHHTKHQIAQRPIALSLANMKSFCIFGARRRIRHFEINQPFDGAFEDFHRLLRIFEIMLLNLPKQILQERHHIFDRENIISENADPVAEETLQDFFQIDSVVFQQVHQPARGRHGIQPACKEPARHRHNKVRRIALAVGKCIGVILIGRIGVPVELITVISILWAGRRHHGGIVRVRVDFLNPVYRISIDFNGNLAFAFGVVKLGLTEEIRITGEGVRLDVIDRLAMIRYRLGDIVLVHMAGKDIMHACIRQRLCNVLIVIQAEILRDRRFQPQVRYQAEMRHTDDRFALRPGFGALAKHPLDEIIGEIATGLMAAGMAGLHIIRAVFAAVHHDQAVTAL